MSDIAPDAPAAPAAPAPAAPPPAAPPPAAPAAPDAGWETTDPADFASWPEPAKKYVQDLRNEAKTRREALESVKPIQDVFSSLHPQDAAYFQQFLAALQTRDPAKIGPLAGPMRELLDQLSPAEQKAVVKAAEAAAADAPFDPYDAAALDKRFETKLEERLAAERGERDKADAAREQERQTQEWLGKMQTKATELATSHGIEEFGDPTSDLGRLLYVVAHNKFSSESDPMKRLELAAQSIEETLGGTAQKLLKAKTADAAPSPAPADAGGPTAAKKPQDLTDASKAARSRLDKILAGEVGT